MGPPGQAHQGFLSARTNRCAWKGWGGDTLMMGSMRCVCSPPPPFESPRRWSEAWSTMDHVVVPWPSAHRLRKKSVLLSGRRLVLANWRCATLLLDASSGLWDTSPRGTLQRPMYDRSLPQSREYGLYARVSWLSGEAELMRSPRKVSSCHSSLTRGRGNERRGRGAVPANRERLPRVAGPSRTFGSFDSSERTSSSHYGALWKRFGYRGG